MLPGSNSFYFSRKLRIRFQINRTMLDRRRGRIVVEIIPVHPVARRPDRPRYEPPPQFGQKFSSISLTHETQKVHS